MKKFMKIISSFLFAFTLIFSSVSVEAADSVLSTYTEYFENVDSFEITVIQHHDEYLLRANSKTKSASKVGKYRDSNGTVLWSVTVTGTFTYNGSTSKCTASKVSAISNNSNWRIASKNSSRSGNTASATATANLYKGSKIIKTATKTVTLSCSKNGTLS